MAASLGKLTVRISATADRFKADMKQAQGAVSRFTKESERAGQRGGLLDLFKKGAAFGAGFNALNLAGKAIRGMVANLEKVAENKAGKFTEQQVVSAMAARDAVADLKTSWDGLTSHLAIFAAPAMREIAQLLRDAADAANEWANSGGGGNGPGGPAKKEISTWRKIMTGLGMGVQGQLGEQASELDQIRAEAKAMADKRQRDAEAARKNMELFAKAQQDAAQRLMERITASARLGTGAVTIETTAGFSAVQTAQRVQAAQELAEARKTNALLKDIKRAIEKNNGPEPVDL